MKILLIHHCDSWGGAGVSLESICRMLVNVHHLTVCIPHMKSRVYEQLKTIPGLNFAFMEHDTGMISAYSGGPGLLTRTFFRNLWRIRRSAKILKTLIIDNKYDLILTNSITLSWANKIAARAGVKNVCYVRETKPKHVGFLLEKILINHYCNGTLFISEYDKQIMKLKVKRQQVIRDCIDLNAYKPVSRLEACTGFGLSEKCFNVLYVGGAEELKGYPVLLEAIKRVKQPDIQFIIAGNVPEAKRIQHDAVHYVGLVFSMPILYCACDLLVFPSTSPHQARPVFEAGAERKAVVISDFPETQYEVIDGYNGKVFSPGNSVQLASIIQDLYTDRTTLALLSDNNYQNTISEHDFEACKSRLLEFCAKL